MDFVVYSLNDNFNEKTGHIGDTIGGILGPLVAIIASILTFLAFWVQKQANNQVQKQFQRQQFETNYFEMLKIYRDNVSEWRFKSVTDISKKENDKYVYEGKIVGNELYGLFKELYKEVGFYSDNYNIEFTDLLQDNYKQKLANFKSTNDNLINNLNEFVRLELAYIALFYGVGEMSRENIKLLISDKYIEDANELFNYLKMKPVCSSNYWNRWIRRRHSFKYKEFWYITKGNKVDDYIKYYGGHEHRLGHFFRHIYSMIRYINKQDFLSYYEKWEYAGFLRNQMSNKEQFLLYLNSISLVGRGWELDPDKKDKIDTSDIIQRKYITKYDLIKHIPKGTREFYFKNDIYPDVEFEGDEKLTPNREKLEKMYK
ncbi:MAG: hypothetical protein JNL75_08570 [Chitinophagales bacterium]|nr:hypothetical protein [Chitinophagales bacterium]